MIANTNTTISKESAELSLSRKRKKKDIGWFTKVIVTGSMLVGVIFLSYLIGFGHGQATVYQKLKDDTSLRDIYK